MPLLVGTFDCLNDIDGVLDVWDGSLRLSLYKDLPKINNIFGTLPKIL
jgi:hypothetical protein